MQKEVFQSLCYSHGLSCFIRFGSKGMLKSLGGRIFCLVKLLTISFSLLPPDLRVLGNLLLLYSLASIGCSRFVELFGFRLFCISTFVLLPFRV